MPLLIMRIKTCDAQAVADARALPLRLRHDAILLHQLAPTVWWFRTFRQSPTLARTRRSARQLARSSSRVRAMFPP